MLSQLGSSPDQSACSSNTGDVLIRSTQVLVSDQRPEPGPGCVQITVQKLRDSPVQPPLSSGAENQQQRPKSRQKPDRAAPLRAAARPQPDRLKKPGPTKENREPRRRVSPHSLQQPGHDLLTSHFAAGSRGVVLAALKRRSHSTPHRREVSVQLLDPGPLQTGSQDAPGPSTSSQGAVGVAGVPSGCHGDATNAAAAAAAAAVAAAAPLIKAQSDMEARVSQLAEGVQQLLQADREGVARGRGLSQQTLHHLETLHSQQLQLQSQLLESALRMVTGHAPVTSDLTASGLQVTHLPDAAGNVLSNQKQGSSATRAPAASVETGPVAMATPHRDRRPEQIRDDWYHRAPGVSTATQPAAGSHHRTSANHSQATARRANEMLREMRRLKTEMKTLLNPENSPRTTRPGPDHHHSQPTHLQSQSQRTESQLSQSQQNQSQSYQRPFLHSQSQQNPSHPNRLQSQTSQSQHNQTQTQSQSSQQPHQTQTQFSQQPHQTQSSQQPHQSQSSQQPHQTQSSQQPHQTQTQSSQQPHQTQSQFSQQPCQSQSSQQPHQTRSQSSQQPHQTQSQFSQQTQSQFSQQPRRRPVVPSMLEEAGLVLRQVRRQKKVLEENLESLRRAKTGEVLHCQLEALAANRDWTKEVRIKKTVDAWINSSTKHIQAEMSSEDAAIEHAAAVTSQQRAAESSAHKGRGRPVSALRGTGSKTAAGSLTTGSKAAAGRGRRGQTAGHRPAQGAEPEAAASEAYLLRLYGRAPYDGLRRTLKKSPYLRLSSPASPLGRKSRPRLVESVTGVKLKSCKTQTCLAPPLTPSPGQPRPHDVIISAGVPMAIPLGRPRMDSSSRRQQEVTSSLTAPPTAGAVVVDDEDGPTGRQEQLEAPPPDDIMRIESEAPPPNDIMRNESEAPPPDDIMRNESEEEEDEDVFPGTDFLSVADVVVQQEDVSVVELDGGPSPPLVLYQGPVFPPQPRAALPAQDRASVLGHNLQRDVLEIRMLEWVEQQLMSRMISEMYRPPPSDPAHNHSVDQSQSEERSVTSDIVEAAGGGGLQLFVDSNVSVDSALIRQLVNEVLTEQVALMLGQRDSLEPEPEPGPGEHQEEEPVPLVQTPLPTPPPSPAPPSRETPPLATPPHSEPTSPLNDEPPQPITAPEHVATPTPSPEPAHSTGSPPAVPQATPPLTWGDSELPLDEERPEEDVDARTQLLVMSVAEEEPPLSSPLPPPSLSLPPPPGPEPGPVPEPASPSDSSSSDSSSSSSSSISTATVATEAALKHISEGELLISVNQLAATTEDGAVFSFSSSLHELQDMDFDPPSEGQFGGHDLLLTKTPRGERPQPEGSWGREEEEAEEEEEEESVGEVRDHRTTNPHRTTKPSSTAARRGQSSSPGQISPCADGSDVSCEATNQGSVAMEPGGTLTSDLDLPLSPPPHTQLHRQTAEQQGGSRRLEVYLPSVPAQDRDADTSSSTDSIF